MILIFSPVIFLMVGVMFLLSIIEVVIQIPLIFIPSYRLDFFWRNVLSKTIIEIERRI